MDTYLFIIIFYLLFEKISFIEQNKKLQNELQICKQENNIIDNFSTNHKHIK